MMWAILKAGINKGGFARYGVKPPELAARHARRHTLKTRDRNEDGPVEAEQLAFALDEVRFDECAPGKGG